MYLYHAHAVAFGGVVERPSPQTIVAQASCSLPISGGISSANAGRFDNGLVSFDSAHSHLTGSAERRGGTDVYHTSVSVVINGLNVGNMFMADRVVTQVTSEHQVPNPEPDIITTGSYFENLKIAGQKVDLEMAHDVFNAFPTYQSCCDAWAGTGPSAGKPGHRTALRERLMGSTLERHPPTPSDPEHLRDAHQGFTDQDGLPNLKPTVIFSCVKSMKGLNAGEINNWQSIIKIPKFGTIYLGEVIVSHGHRHVNMVRLQLGSPQSGGFTGGGGGSNGTTYP